MSVYKHARLRKLSVSSGFRSLSSSRSVSALDPNSIVSPASPSNPYPASPSRKSKVAQFAALGVRSAPSAAYPEPNSRSSSTTAFLTPRAASFTAALLSPLRSLSLRHQAPALHTSTSCTSFTEPAAPAGLSVSASLASLASFVHSPSLASTPLRLRLPSPPPSTPPESPTARSRRAAPPPPMTVRTTPAAHTLDVHLPHADQCRLMPEMVTVAARQGARLRVVVDYWALERDAHFEWEVAFVHADVDLSAVRAVLAPDGHLAIRVRRCVGAPARRDVVPVVWSPYA